MTRYKTVRLTVQQITFILEAMNGWGIHEGMYNAREELMHERIIEVLEKSK